MRILVISPQDVYFAKRLAEEARLASVGLDILPAAALAESGPDFDIAPYGCLYVRFCYPYFMEVIDLARRFLAAGKKVVDAGVAGGDLGLGKLRAYRRLQEAGLPVPKTSALAEAQQWQYPCIVKWNYGFGGKEVFLIKDVAALKRATEFLPAEELLLQDFVRAEYEHKVLVAGYKALPVVLRFHINKQTWRPDFATAETIHTPAAGPVVQKLLRLAEDSARALGRELAKVDILQAGGDFYVLEANRWPGLKSFEENTGFNAAREFLAYLAQ
ncbi:MAG: ATP-grasp domain-containing protein [Patescibacteria group bacterium]|nr:ATP-grasp domain-containing protein [Patescibacteria group bacterium]